MTIEERAVRNHDDLTRMADASKRVLRARDYRPIWREFHGDIDLCVLIGREALNRAPEMQTCWQAVETAIEKLQALPGGRALALEMDDAVNALHLATADIATAAAMSAAYKLDGERLYAAAVEGLPFTLGLVTRKDGEGTLTPPHDPPLTESRPPSRPITSMT